MNMVKKLHVVLATDEGVSASDLFNLLISEGFVMATSISCCDNLSDAILQYQPDVLVVNVDNPHDELFDQLLDISEQYPLPVVLFSDKGEKNIIKKVVQAGVGAYVVDGLPVRQIRPVIELSIERFKAMRVIKNALVTAKNRLEERKVVEKAKGIVMANKKINENDAYQAIRQLAMSQNKKMLDIAKNIIEVSSVLS